MDKLQRLQAAALEAEFIALAREISAPKDPRLAHQPEPCTLVLRSGVAKDNDNTVGTFSCRATADLCARFLMAIDRVYQPEYSKAELIPLETP